MGFTETEGDLDIHGKQNREYLALYQGRPVDRFPGHHGSQRIVFYRTDLPPVLSAEFLSRAFKLP